MLPPLRKRSSVVHYWRAEIILLRRPAAQSEKYQFCRKAALLQCSPKKALQCRVTNTLSQCKYILQFAQIHIAIWTNTLSILKKYTMWLLRGSKDTSSHFSSSLSAVKAQVSSRSLKNHLPSVL